MMRHGLAQLASVNRQTEADRLRAEIIELAAVHVRLLAIAVELRTLGMASSAHHVRADARFTANAVAGRATTLGYGLVKVADAAERARRERSPYELLSRTGT